MTFRQTCPSCEGQQLSRANPETSKTRICLSEGQSTCPVRDPGWWNHTGFSCSTSLKLSCPLATQPWACFSGICSHCAGVLGCHWNIFPEFNSPFLLRCVGGQQFPWSQQGLFQTVKCKPGKKMALKTLPLILEGSVRCWIDTPSAQSPCPACQGTQVAGRQVGDSFSLEIFSYS